MMTGEVFNIQRFCVNDGPGIRTTVFLKGCPLRCKWCHNPESQRTDEEITFDAEKCVRCGACVAVCGRHLHILGDSGHVYARENCVACGTCVEACNFSALEKVGKPMSVEEALEVVLKDKVFYENSQGGMTLSGGEPMTQFDFSYELLRRAKQAGLHTCMETCGFASADRYRKISEATDLFLYDWKLSDDELHKQYTGVSNQLIRENIAVLEQAGGQIVLRCPIIPGLNDTDAHFESIVQLANSHSNIIRVELEPYHSFGNGKYPRLDRQEEVVEFSVPQDADVKNWIAQLRDNVTVPVKKA